MRFWNGKQERKAGLEWCWKWWWRKATESSITGSFRIPAPKDYHLFSAALRPHHNIPFLNNRILRRTLKSPSSKVACTSSYKRWNSCDKLKLKVVKRRKKMSGENTMMVVLIIPISSMTGSRWWRVHSPTRRPRDRLRIIPSSDFWSWGVEVGDLARRRRGEVERRRRSATESLSDESDELEEESESDRRIGVRIWRRVRIGGRWRIGFEHSSSLFHD